MKMVQVRVRAKSVRPALAMPPAATSPAPSPKRRKIHNDNDSHSNNITQDLNFSSPSSFIDHFKSISNDAPQPLSTAEERGFSTRASSPTSCCSSNGSFGLDPEVDSAQLETSTCSCSDQIRKEMSPSSELRTNTLEVESMEKPKTQANSRCVIPAMKKKMPMELELEEFFSAAEKDLQKRFSDKYNYDVVKDVPSEGRYEWVELKP